MRFLLNVVCFVCTYPAFAQINYLYVASKGDDKNSGKPNEPVQSINRALELSRSYAGKKVSIQMLAGTYYLKEPVKIIHSENFPSELEITAAENQKVSISAGRLLTPDWQYFKNGIYRTSVPAGISFERFFVNGILQTLARYPNVDSTAKVFQGTAEDAIYYVRVLTWGNPFGGYVHALDEHRKGSLHYKITGVDDTDNLELDGGWQSRKSVHMSEKERFVENVFGELDAPGEWYLDKTVHVLYYYPAPATDLSKAKFEISSLKNSLILKGSDRGELKNVRIKNLNFVHTERSFMDSKDTLAGSDWNVYRGGALSFENTQDCRIEDCTFSDLGGNAIVFNNRNENGAVTGCLISNIGASGVSILGDCLNCVIKDNLFLNSGIIEKQGVAIFLNGVNKVNIYQNTMSGMPGPGLKIENSEMQNLQIELNNTFKIYQEVQPAGQDVMSSGSNNNSIPTSGVQKPKLKALIPILKDRP